MQNYQKKNNPLLAECIELFDSVEAYYHERFRSNINDKWGTIDFDSFNENCCYGQGPGLGEIL